MFEWISNNKEWLFSGVGLAVVSWIFFRQSSKGNTASNRSVAADNIKDSQIVIGESNKTKR